jgi:hypothetical protein
MSERTASLIRVHVVGEKPKVFPTLNAALKHCRETQLTGYVVDPDGNTINIRKGKRIAVGGAWVSA